MEVMAAQKAPFCFCFIVSGTLTQVLLNCERDAHACPPKFAGVVQSVEQALRKRQVVGSIPTAGSGKFWRVK